MINNSKPLHERGKGEHLRKNRLGSAEQPMKSKYMYANIVL